VEACHQAASLHETAATPLTSGVAAVVIARFLAPSARGRRLLNANRNRNRDRNSNSNSNSKRSLSRLDTFSYTTSGQCSRGPGCIE
jgi:predicted amino acid dehydrogenase